MPVPRESGPLHSCTEAIDLICANRRDLKDSPLTNANKVWFIDGSSFVRQDLLLRVCNSYSMARYWNMLCPQELLLS